MASVGVVESAIDIVIYLHDDSGIMFKVRGGQNAEAKFLFDLLIDELNVNDTSGISDVFSLWLVSDLLELQLKPSHVPFKLICYWEELLEKYVHCTEDVRQRDEAVIMLQRNVYATIKDEEKISHPTLLKLLYCEAKKNVVNGKYPVSCDVADHLAIIQSFIYEKEHVEQISSNFFLNKAVDLLPSIHCRRNILINRAQNPENRLMKLYLEYDQDGTYKNVDEVHLYNEYLRECRKLFQYGAAFFSGQAERLGKKLDDPVVIAISHSGVCITCASDQAVLLVAPFERLSWQFAESTSNDTNLLPCLFLHFPYSVGRESSSKLLQIFSKSACLADNLIETLVAMHKPGEVFPREEVKVDLTRMALMTFDAEGKKIGNTIRLPKNTGIPNV